MARKIWTGSRICALIFPMMLGCGGGNDTGTSTVDTTTTSSSENPPDGTTPKGGAPGGPVGTKPGGGAQGSPMKVPAFAAAGVSLEFMKSEVERVLKEACGDGTLCVKIHYVEPAKNDDNCRVEKVQPPTTVNRNSTLTVTITCKDKAISSVDGSTTTTTTSS
jgi:hypothetical protein